MSTSSRHIDQPATALARPALTRRLALVVASLLAVGIIVVLASYNLEYYPTTWFDEGSHLHVPKTLVQAGVYADRSAEGFRYYGPTAGVGPTVLLPIALAFKVAGIGLLQARLVMVGFLLATIALFFLVARRLDGTATAWLATALLVTAPGVNLLYVGRQVLGEAPALGFLLIGVLAWWRGIAPAPRQGRFLALAALGFGLAALTKSQFALLLAPTLVVVGLLDRFYYRQLRPRCVIVPLLGVGAAIGLNLLIQIGVAVAGTGDVWGTLRLLREASGGAIFVFAPARMLSSLKFLFSADAYAFWAVPGLIYAFMLARERSLAGLRRGWLVTFATLGLAWFVFGSIGWPRYAFPALALTALFVARLFVDLLRALTRRASASTTPPVLANALRLALTVGLAVLLLVPLQQTARLVLTTTDRSPQLVAAYLQSHVPSDAIIETWEPELGLLTDHRYHYPPSGWLDRAVRTRWLGASGGLTGYDPIAETNPTFLVVGPFGKFSGIYAETLALGAGQPVTSVGEYDVYRLPPASAPTRSP